MGESTCLMQQPFSYVSGIPNEAKEVSSCPVLLELIMNYSQHMLNIVFLIPVIGNPIHALGQSISFGRFMSDSLAWEKWSTFSHNRYVEEAEKHSRPGSVAQKKAFFEAHYKNLAARKAAALLEQANAAASHNVPEPESEEGVATQDSQTMISNSEVMFHEREEVNAPDMEESLVSNSNGYNSNAEMGKSGSSKLKVADPATEQPVLVESTEKVETLSQVVVADVRKEVQETELSGTTQLKKPLSKWNQEVSVPMSKKKPTLSSSKSSTHQKAAKDGSRKDNYATPMNKKPLLDSSEKKTPRSLHMSVSFTPIREINKLTSSVIRKIENSRLGANSFKESKDCFTPLKTPTMKLEEKFNANEAQKEHMQIKLKEKAEREIGKLRPSLCFKARPLPDFYKQRKTPKHDVKKAPSTHQQSPKLRTHPSPGRFDVDGKTSLPPHTSSVKNSSSKHMQGKNSRIPSFSLISRSTKITHENTSPNIQQG
ncbi:hypothetical protein FNV43_RR14207 [Rhamnella rubrinervis]|uniref:TPX2 C-terminal domain-containing protein n=1 Tax=Rhamnella rubrinervis TaxID=2594499 RepID=A0A8K0MG51_9ROSA|nr:hypothetical protein FNV43_RR14207 [Rhamnella rubrinervis]